MFLPTNIREMEELGWDSLDVILVSGDAYIDHPSFGVTIVGKFLIKHGFKVGIIAQPDISSNIDFKLLPIPRLFIGISSGNVDSLVNNYTASKKKRRTDDYSENGEGGKRPDRAVIAYTNKVKENYKGVPVVIGGVEASLRRVAHYDYWSDKIRRSILFDSKADLLVFGQGERTTLRIAEELTSGKKIEDLTELRGTSFIAKKDTLEKFNSNVNYISLPTFEEVTLNMNDFLKAEKIIHDNKNPYLNKGFIQETNRRFLIVNPPTLPDENLDEVFESEFERSPHPMYKGRIPAWDMIRNSITIHRGCFGGCTFCSISLHQGNFIQSRSEKNIKDEISSAKLKTITDLGGPSANMYKMKGKDTEICKKCKKLSCIFPGICKNLDIDHKKLLSLYKEIKKDHKVFVNSGLRHELALTDNEYMKQIAEHYTSGLLKIAPEHTERRILDLMLKPSIDKYEEFVTLFKKYSKKEQYVLPYLISAFPGTTLTDAENMMYYLKRNNIRVEQVQDFIPLPMTIAAAMYFIEKDFFTGEKIHVAKSYDERKKHRQMMQWWKR
ncbi:MAG: YgiQ family radical SAM protein [Candidatus Delongbacteria bacterium]|nr:YgiQ family radical SAM protein [Candidatus Delongbacteria bacterium]